MLLLHRENLINRIMQKKKIVMVAALAIMSAISGKAQQQAVYVFIKMMPSSWRTTIP